MRPNLNKLISMTVLIFSFTFNEQTFGIFYDFIFLKYEKNCNNYNIIIITFS